MAKKEKVLKYNKNQDALIMDWRKFLVKLVIYFIVLSIVKSIVTIIINKLRK